MKESGHLVVDLVRYLNFFFLVLVNTIFMRRSILRYLCGRIKAKYINENLCKNYNFSLTSFNTYILMEYALYCSTIK